jgi:hypothetical protein
MEFREKPCIRKRPLAAHVMKPTAQLHEVSSRLQQTAGPPRHFPGAQEAHSALATVALVSPAAASQGSTPSEFHVICYYLLS